MACGAFLWVATGSARAGGFVREFYVGSLQWRAGMAAARDVHGNAVSEPGIRRETADVRGGCNHQGLKFAAVLVQCACAGAGVLSTAWVADRFGGIRDSDSGAASEDGEEGDGMNSGTSNNELRTPDAEFYWKMRKRA